jgi:hypothetical protein
MNKRIEIGSQAFFSGYEDYVSHDKDYIEFQDEPKLFKTFMNARGKGVDIFFYKTMSKEEFIKYELEHCKKLPMAAGKFLVPELCEYMNITIDDLKLFEEAFKNIDDRHTYEQIIYEAYLENNSFTLTNEQRDDAYKKYKECKDY